MICCALKWRPLRNRRARQETTQDGIVQGAFLSTASSRRRAGKGRGAEPAALKAAARQEHASRTQGPTHGGEAIKAHKIAAKKAAEQATAQAKAAEVAAKAAASPPPTESERKAARDARYAARKNRK